jgi:hypothetical protein
MTTLSVKFLHSSPCLKAGDSWPILLKRDSRAPLTNQCPTLVAEWGNCMPVVVCEALSGKSLAAAQSQTYTKPHA